MKKLGADRVAEYRRRYRAGGVTVADLATEAGVLVETMRDALSGLSYPGVAERPVEVPSRRRKLTDPQVREIRRLHADEGVSQAELGRRYGVSREAVRQILRRHIYARVN